MVQPTHAVKVKLGDSKLESRSHCAWVVCLRRQDQQLSKEMGSMDLEVQQLQTRGQGRK